MQSLSIIRAVGKGLIFSEIAKTLSDSLEQFEGLKKVLIIPPDCTRSQSGAGTITEWYYKKLMGMGIKVDIMPALGTHMAMTEDELATFFGYDIPMSAYIVHNYRDDVVKIGEVPASYIEEISEGLADEAIDVEVNKRLLDKSYDLILSVGQVVPHEVVGMANYSKNIFVGCGGRSMINKTHMLGAIFGMERVMGQDFSPVRKVFDYAEENFITDMPIMYVLTVCTAKGDDVYIHGLFTGRDRKLFEGAVALSQQLNLNYVERLPKKVVVHLDEHEFKTTWVGNKAIYRTRMMIADGGELIIIAPGVRQCGEDLETDKLIKKYGFVGRLKVLELLKNNDDLMANQSVAAHLIHGSSDGRFRIIHAPGHMNKEDIESINFEYMDINDALSKYPIDEFKDGWNTVDGEEIFYVSNPALGLWADKNKIK